MKTLPLLLASAALLSLPALADDTAWTEGAARGPRFAQADEAPERGLFRRGHGRRLPPEQRKRLEQEVRRKMGAYLTAELSSRLGLSEEKAAKLSVAIDRHRERRDERHGRLRTEMKALRDLVDKKAPDEELAAQVKRVSEARRSQDEMGELLAETARFLSAEEQARLVLAFPEVMRDVRKMMREARRERRRQMRGGFGAGSGDVAE